MKFYNIIIKYRFWLSLFALAVAILLNVSGKAGFYQLFLVFFRCYWYCQSFFYVPLRLIQEPMEAGNIEEVKKILAGVWYPNLLYKPVRSTFTPLKAILQ
jgi:hypothetical protein